MRVDRRWIRACPVVVILGLLVVGLYYDTFQWLYERYMAADSYYSHGFLIPVVSSVLVWRRRKELRSFSAQYSRAGLIILLGSLLLHLIGTLVHFFFLSGLSFFFFILGSVLFLFGKHLTKRILFPIMFLIFMIPLPLPLISALLYPMKVFVLFVSSRLLTIAGIPLYVEGFKVHLPEGSLLIGNPCSGLRSLIAFMAMGALIAHISTSSIKKGIIIFTAAVPAAFLSNIIRTICLILVAHSIGIEYAAPDYWFHDFSGLGVFGLGLGGLLLLARVMNGKA